MAGDTDEAAGCMRRVRPGIYRRPRHAEILQFLLPPLRPPARREQSCPFVAEKGSPAYLPLPEMRQAGAGDRADGPAHQVLSAHCERLYWKHSKKVSSVVIRRAFQCRNCGTFVEITEPKDKRTIFCSQACREKWFSLHRNKNTLHVNVKRNSVDRRDIV